MAKPEEQPAPRSRISVMRRRRIARIVARLKEAIERDPFLLRLPSMIELAELCSASLREVRYALAELSRDGWVKYSRGGYRAVRRAQPDESVRTVILIHHYINRVAPFGHFIAQGAELRCRQLGARMQGRWFDHDQWKEHPDALLADVPASGVGWLLADPASRELGALWLAQGRRFVLLDVYPPQIALPSVRLDHMTATDLAVEHLRSLGHRRIAAITRRSPAVLAAIQQKSHLLMKDWCEQAHFPLLEDVSQYVRQWIARWRAADVRPTAVIVHSLIDALVFLSICRSVGIESPGELSVLGLGSDYGREQSPLTFVNSGNATDLGRAAVDLLMKPDVMQAHPTVTLPAALEQPGLTTGPPGRDR